MSEILFCTIIIMLSLVAIVGIVGMTIYNINKIQVLSEKKYEDYNNLG